MGILFPVLPAYIVRVLDAPLLVCLVDVPDGHRVPQVAEDVIAPTARNAVVRRAVFVCRQSHRHNRLFDARSLLLFEASDPKTSC